MEFVNIIREEFSDYFEMTVFGFADQVQKG
jgi:hypothetical protein